MQLYIFGSVTEFVVPGYKLAVLLFTSIFLTVKFAVLLYIKPPRNDVVCLLASWTKGKK